MTRLVAALVFGFRQVNEKLWALGRPRMALLLPSSMRSKLGFLDFAVVLCPFCYRLHAHFGGVGNDFVAGCQPELIDGRPARYVIVDELPELFELF